MNLRSSSGFTKLELVTVLAIIVIVTSIAIPAYWNMVRQVRASHAVADLQTLRAAAYLYFGDHADWPAEVQLGVVPAELKPYLREDMEFVNQWYQIDWDNWMVWDDPVGPGNTQGEGKGHGKARSKLPQTGVLVGVSLVTRDPELMAAARGMLANAAFIRISASKSTLKLSDADGF